MTNTGEARWTDRRFLKGDQYRTDKNLLARQSIYAFQQPQIDLPRVVIDLIGTEGNETVVDVGCGNGRYLAALKEGGHPGPLVGIDMSEGMLAAARTGVQDAYFACGDASALPLRSGAADLALAMHMLYHVPDVALAVAELRRITAGTGRVVIALNEEDHLQEMRAAVAATAQSLGLPPMGRAERLTLSEGEDLVRGTFSSVVRHDLEAELVVTATGPLESYVRSGINPTFLPEAQQEEYVAAVLKNLPVNQNGEVRIKTHAGCLICS